MLSCSRALPSSSLTPLPLPLLFHLSPSSIPKPSNLSFTRNPNNVLLPSMGQAHQSRISGSSWGGERQNLENATISISAGSTVVKKRKRYRRSYPGESKGIVEEMRFVAMRLRTKPTTTTTAATNPISNDDEDEGGDGATWRPSMEGFLKYLVNSGLVFQTLERIVHESSEVSFTYFRNSGLERSASISKDLEWFKQQGIVIPEPSTPGTSYSKYLQELAEKSAPSFLCHLYNIYFAHIAGGQGIGKQVCEMLLEGREMELYKWEGEVPELLNDVREKLNKLGEHWSRDEKNRCLREASKSFKFSGQIVRLIIL